ncbi:MAG: hypothetical protein HY471_00410 [Candidatus Sungbacteria bacterium]|nr:hypothetical protein [Candidatus Sungbacteria bacterium]
MNHRLPRWVQNAQAKERSRDERARLRRAAYQCENGNFEGFSFLKLEYDRDRHRVLNLIAEELNLRTYDEAEARYAEWERTQSSTSET